MKVEATVSSAVEQHLDLGDRVAATRDFADGPEIVLGFLQLV